MEQNLVQLTAASEHSCLAGLPNDPKLKITSKLSTSCLHINVR